jgi:5-methylcytosine-specific restriction endonuclease McrA
MTCARDWENRRYAALDRDSRKHVASLRAGYYREWREQRREHLAAYGAAYRKSFKAKCPNYWKERYARDREKLKRKATEWYQANAERAGQRQKAYAAKRRVDQPDHVRALARRTQAKRRALKKNVFIEAVDPRVVFRRDKGKCGICRKRVDVRGQWEVDHIIPISKGGVHSYDNVQLAHLECNRKKSATIPKGQPTLFQVAPSKCDW